VSFEEFFRDPWRKPHRAYDESVFNIRPAPEFSTAEVLVSSLYRACGFHGYGEMEVPQAGREFDKTTRPTRKHRDESGRIKIDTWRTIIHGVLESPKQPNQSSKRFLQLCPVIPEIALYSGSARLAGSSWNPGLLVQRMIRMGAANDVAAEELWAKLHDALTVSLSDDLWARWLQEEFQSRHVAPKPWKQSDLEYRGILSDADKSQLSYPAQQFVKDLDAVISAKGKMTRRQWISILEAMLRLGCVMLRIPAIVNSKSTRW
jgi:hypothetical protein